MDDFPIGVALPDGVMFYIGNFVVLFSRIEFAASFSLRMLSGMEDATAASFVNNMNLKGKLAAVKALAVPKLAHASNLERSEYALIEKWIGYTESVLLPERNRISHDEWHMPLGDDDGARRVKPHSLIKKDRSFEIRVEYSSQKNVTAEYLRTLCINTNDAAFAIGLLGHFFGPDTPGIQMMKPPPPPPEYQSH